MGKNFIININIINLLAFALPSTDLVPSHSSEKRRYAFRSTF